ncbi:hypothetical protein HNP84_001055 [Thermocatellispora tengchongensis]|uniref:HEAT repeat domain-containing protein n=1 Tax=Thermocatellispora tengchongensis TaxID=1073253 RepID=A0A840NX30_9ACTN|nr:hypothetical protein [Thermocatellispora tengchongensis]MBB5131349.1 hypothetical protein [Thermocatellispora tengchongensis]
MTTPTELIDGRTDWSRLFHAYGMATDTPGHLRALVGDDEDARQTAIYHLDAAVIHQGTPWTVTPAAAEVVADLLADPATARPFAAPHESEERPLRAILLDFLAEAAHAAFPDAPEEEVRAAAYPEGDDLDVPALAAEMFRTDALEDGEEWAQEVLNTGISRAVLELREIAPTLAARVRPWLDDDDPYIRASAAEALAALEAVPPLTGGS